jgi:predicted dehydrogenase
VLMVGHLLEYHPVVTRLREMIAREELGRLYYIYSQRVNLGTVRADENALWNFAPHDISVIMFLLGATPTDVTARGQSYLQKGVEDVVFLSMNFAGRAMAHVHVSWLTRKSELTCRERKMAVFDDLEANEKPACTTRARRSTTTPSPSTWDALRRHYDAFYQGRRAAADQCRHFIECVRGTPGGDGQDACASSSARRRPALAEERRASRLG